MSRAARTPTRMAAAQSARKYALARLHRDLKEVISNPLPTVAATPLKDDVRLLILFRLCSDLRTVCSVLTFCIKNPLERIEFILQILCSIQLSFTLRQIAKMSGFQRSTLQKLVLPGSLMMRAGLPLKAVGVRIKSQNQSNSVEQTETEEQRNLVEQPKMVEQTEMEEQPKMVVAQASQR